MAPQSTRPPISRRSRPAAYRGWPRRLAAVAAVITPVWLLNTAVSEPYDPTRGWQTRQPSLVCANYFAIDDGWRAAKANDQKWLNETGCTIAQGGLPLTPIDTKSDNAWRVRLRGPGGDATVYMPSQFVVNFAKSTGYKTEKEAQTAATEMVRRYKKQHSTLGDMPYHIVSSGTKWAIQFGPESDLRLGWFCESAQESKETYEEESARRKRAADAYSRALKKHNQIWEDERRPYAEQLRNGDYSSLPPVSSQMPKMADFEKPAPKPGPRYACDRPSLN